MKYMDYICDSCELISVELLERIEKAREGCENLGIGILSDEMVYKKFSRRPLRPYEERAKIMGFIRGVDFVFKVTNEETIEIKKEEFYYNNPKTKMYKIGYAPGTYDLLHQGHIEHLTEAFSQCEILVVGINDDDLVESYKHKRPLMPAAIRANIVSQLRFVSATFIADTLERGKANEWIKKKYGSPIDAVFIGSDWQGQDLHNKENLNIVFTYRDPKIAKTRSTTYYRAILEERFK